MRTSLRSSKPDFTACRAEPNDRNRKGADASKRVRFGKWGRYAVGAVHTRFDAVEWFVWDAETPEPGTTTPSVIRQEPTLAAAIAGLDTSDEEG